MLNLRGPTEYHNPQLQRRCVFVKELCKISIAVERSFCGLADACKRNSQSAGFMQSISKYFSYRAAGQHARIRHQYEAVATMNNRHTLSRAEMHHECVNDMWNILLCMWMMIQDSSRCISLLFICAYSCRKTNKSECPFRASVQSRTTASKPLRMSYIVNKARLRVASLHKKGTRGCLSDWMISSPPWWILIKPPSTLSLGYARTWRRL